MADENRKIEYWRGKLIADMTRDELIDALQSMADREASSYATVKNMHRLMAERHDQRKSAFDGLGKAVLG